VTDVSQVEVEGHDLAKAILKSALQDPGARIADHLHEQLCKRVIEELGSPEAVPNSVRVALRLSVHLARYARDGLKLAQAHGVTWPHDLDSPYDALFVLTELDDEPRAIDPAVIDFTRGVLEED
jgi:hypothetical protein